MTLAEWEQQAGYTNLHNCIDCKHCECEEYAPCRNRRVCGKKIDADVGKTVKASHSCNLWEARKK